MAGRSDALPSAIDQAGQWFWNFLKKELTPYPGRGWVAGRVTISATIVMLLVMTFRLPGGFLGAIFTLFLSRENPTATLQAGFRTIVAFLLATLYALVGVRLLLADPMTHFLWVATSLFLSFYLIRIFVDYGASVAFGFMIAGAIPLWDETTLNVNQRLENMLWLTYVVVIGVVVTIAVEYVFRLVHPRTDLTEGIEIRLQTVERLLGSVGTGKPLDREAEELLSLYSTVGTSRLRRLIIRSEYGQHFKEQMSTAIALLGRLVDIASSFHLSLTERTEPIPETDRKRCQQLAEQIEALCSDLMKRQLPRELTISASEEPSSLRFLPAMERTVSLIPQAFSGSDSMQEFIPAPMDDEVHPRLIVPDAFTNPAHAQFALRGTLAAMVCYITYTAIDWPGLSTSVATCFITALSTIGSSRQKQILRLGGAFLGGFVFGMGAQVFVLPFLDTIAGFTVLFLVVTAISAWISTASARLSYLGVQVALAFYLINLQEFTIQTSLSIARDRVFGVLLGLVSMWLFFDRLWVRNALDEMQTVFSRNLELLALLAEQVLEGDMIAAIKRVRQLRDQINAGFQAVVAQSDAILFEFGPERQRKLEIREDIRRWQPAIRTFLQVQITSWQYRIDTPLSKLPTAVAEAHIAFETDIARVLRAIANQINRKPATEVPDIGESARRLQQEIVSYYQERGVPLSTQASDVIGLTDSLASILAPLYEDIRSTFASHEGAGSMQPRLLEGESHS